MRAYSQILSSRIFINYRGKNSNCMVEKPNRHRFNRVIKISITRKKTYRHHVLPDVQRRVQHDLCGILVPNTQSQPNKKKSLDKPELREPMKNWRIIFKSIMKDWGTSQMKGDWKHYNNRVQCWILDWILTHSEKETGRRAGEIQIKSVVYLIILYQRKYFGFDICTIVM